MIAYEEDSILDFLLIPFRLEGSVAARAARFALPAALLVWALLYAEESMPGLLEDLHINDVSFTQVSVLWGAATAILLMLLSFRTNRAMARFWEGTGLLHQMRGEWFDSVSCCITFSRAALQDKPNEVRDFRHTIVRLMSLCHGSALQEISLSENDDLETIDTLGLSDATLQHLKDCRQNHDFNRVEVVLHLIQSLIAKSLDDGVLKVAPPILSRVYQTLSRGFVNLLNAKKIADTRFPFPYAQTIAVLLMINMILTPLLILRSLNSQVWAPIFCFVPLFGMFSLNFIGAELENPFGNDDNDLPLDHFQTEMNKCLMMLLQGNADLLPGISKSRCVLDYDELREKVFSGAKAGRCVRLSSFECSEDSTRMSEFVNAAHGEGSLASAASRFSRALAPRASVRRGGLSDAPEPKILSSRVSSFQNFTSERPELLEHDVMDCTPTPSLAKSAPQSRASSKDLPMGGGPLPGPPPGVSKELPLGGGPLLGPLPEFSHVGGITTPTPILSPVVLSKGMLELQVEHRRLQEGEPRELREALRRLQVSLDEETIRSLARSADALWDVIATLPGTATPGRGIPDPEPKAQPELKAQPERVEQASVCCKTVSEPPKWT